MKKCLMLIIGLVIYTESIYCKDNMEIKIDNFSISIPSGWIAQYTNNSTVFIVYSPIEENDTFQENGNLTIEKIPTKYTTKGYLDAAKEVINKVYSNFTLVERGDDYHIFTGTLNNVMLMQLQFVSIKEDMAYVVTYTSNPDNFNRYYETFKNIQKTFKY